MAQFKMTNLVKESGFDSIASLNNPNLREFIGLPQIDRANRNLTISTDISGINFQE